MANETAAQRYDRDYLHMSGGRKTREMDNQTAERRQRLYVNSANGVSATAVGDNTNPPTTN